jgi:phosphomannomutase
MSPSTEFRCPGENYTISRAIHLARLLQGYEGCRQCPSSGDTAGLSQRQIRQLAEVHSRPVPLSLFYDEGVRSPTLEGLSLAKARSIARAWADCLSATHSIDDPVQMVVGSDGRAATAALNAAVCEGARSSGATVIDAVPASAPCLANCIAETQADGGLLIGTPAGFASGVSIKFWNHSIAVSRGKLLTALESASSEVPSPTPMVRFGTLVRTSPETAYLDTLRPLYHALRPFRVVLGTTCRPIIGYLEALTQNVACTIVLRDRPLSRVAELIESHQAHFAMEIEDDGEVCRVWDEQAHEVPPEVLFAWIAGEIRPERVVLESTASPSLAENLAAAKIPAVSSDPLRQSMAEAMQSAAATLGGGPSGRIWYAGQTTSTADALQTLTIMFNLLSRSDRSLSYVLGTLRVP